MLVYIYLCLDTRSKYHHRVYYGADLCWKANSQCLFQDVWIYEHDSSNLLSKRFQVGSLHEDPSKVHVFSSGVFSFYLTKIDILSIIISFLRTDLQ